MFLSKVLPIICFAAFSLSETKVGLLISKSDYYNNALKSLSRYAVQNADTPYNLTIVEYDTKLMKSMIDACCQLITSGVSVVITKGDSTDTAIQSDIFSALKIPHIAVSATDPFLWNQDREYLIRLSASDIYQSKAIYDLIKHYKWPEVTILTTADSYGLNGIITLENLLLKDHSVTLKDLILVSADNCTANEASDKLREIEYSLVKVIVLNAAAQFGKCILKKAHDLGLMGSDFVWIVTDAIASQPEYLAEHDGNYLSIYEGLLGIRPTQVKGEKYNKFKDTYILKGGKVSDLTSYTILTYDAVGLVEQALKATSKENISHNIECSTESKGWIKGKFVLDSILKTSYTGISGKINFTNHGERSGPSYDILNFVDNKFIPVGLWANSSGLDMNSNVQFFKGTKVIPTGVASSLSGRHLRLGTVEEKPFMFYSADGCTGNDCWTGMVNDMIIELAKLLNFTYDYVQPDDLKFGGLNETTKEWNGMIGDLLTGRTDMIAIDLSTNSARKTAIEFSFPFMDSGIKAVVKGESGTSNDFFFLSPFNGLVWGMVFIVNFILVVLICCLSKLSPYGKYGAKLHAVKTCPCDECFAKREEMRTTQCSLKSTKKYECLIEKVEEEDRSTDASLYNSLWMITTGMVAQTSETLPHCLSARFLLLTWWAFMLIVISLYTANLTASLTLSNLGISLNTVKDLLSQDKYEWGVIGSRHPETLLKTHMDSSYSRLVDEGVKLTNLGDGFEAVRKGHFVFIDESPVLAYNLKGDCDVFSVGEEFQTFEYAFGLPKDSPYKSLIDTYLIKFRENGLIDKLWKKWSEGNTACSSSGMGEQVTFDLFTLAGVFYLLCVGVVISFILLAVEFVYATFKDTKQVEDLPFMKAFERRIRFIWENLSN